MDIVEQAITNYACWLLSKKDGEKKTSPSLFDDSQVEIQRLKSAYKKHVIPFITSHNNDVLFSELYARDIITPVEQAQPAAKKSTIEESTIDASESANDSNITAHQNMDFNHSYSPTSFTNTNIWASELVGSNSAPSIEAAEVYDNETETFEPPF